MTRLYNSKTTARHITRIYIIIRRAITCLLLLFATIFHTEAENYRPDQNVWPESPRAAGIRQVMMSSPSLLTGAIEFDIPIYTIEVEGYSLPLSLHYRSNGVKPIDDPEPIGYGWALTPPMRITREINGFPDELSVYKGDEGPIFFSADYMNGFKGMSTQYKLDGTFHDDAYDTQKDIFTVYLPDRTLKMVYIDGTLKGVGCGEYKVECASRLQSISVTDPQGVCYVFSESGEYLQERGMRLEWLLKSIKLPSGTTLSVAWTTQKHLISHLSSSDPQTIYYTGTSHPSYRETVTDRRVTKFHEFENTKNLSYIHFPGGGVSCSYTTVDPMTVFSMTFLSSINVFTTEGTLVRKATLSHDGSLLTSVDLTGTGKWSFDYHNPNAFNPTNTKSYSAIDWWGYYNGAANDANLSPKVWIPNVFQSTGSKAGADRSVNASVMNANLLKSVKYPTGAITEWETEPHSFDPVQPEEWESARLNNIPVLSSGGGLRVKRIIMKENEADPSPRTRRYVYGENGDGKAVAEAVPVLSSFISDTPFWNHYHDSNMCYMGIDNCLVIGRFSNYLEGQSGLVPLWYRKVVEIEEEGKTEYGFDSFYDSNSVLRSWGNVVQLALNTAFSDGPQLVSRRVFKGKAGDWTEVEKEEYTYTVDQMEGHDRIPEVHLRRQLLIFAGEFPPDFGLDEHLTVPPRQWLGRPFEEPPTTGLVNRDANIWYAASKCHLVPRRERLTMKKTTEYAENGSREIIETYSVVEGTGLPAERKVGCAGRGRWTSYGYSNAKSMGQLGAMTSRNIRIPVEVRDTVDRSPAGGYSLEMSPFGSVYRPQRVWSRNGSTEWYTASYKYDSKGRVTKRTGTDGTVTEWTYDDYGNPLKQTVGGSLVSEATWSHLIGPLSLKDPSGVKRQFTYDSSGRLASSKLNNRIQEEYSYLISQTGDSYIKTNRRQSSTASTAVTARYDGLGREWGVFTAIPGGDCLVSMTGYDAMGRKSQVWSPVTAGASATREEVASAAAALYSDSRPYATTEYESSPRELATAMYRAGEEPYANGEKTTVRRYVNDTGSRKCPLYLPGTSGVSTKGVWPPGSLLIEETTDEAGHCVATYTDYVGNMVCRKDGGVATYFVYDEFDRIRYILPPGITGALTRTSSGMQELAYWYDYDARGRMTLKKLPGVKGARMVYDPADRLVGECSAHHPDTQWRLYGYDFAGRLVVKADFTMTDAQASAYASECRLSVLEAGGAYGGYTMPGAPSGGKTVMASYYDSYDFITVNALPSSFNWSGSGFTFSFANPGKVSAGLLTGVYTGKGYETYYYNLDGQLMETNATGFNEGRTNCTYTYSGAPAKRWWTLPDGTVRTLEWSYDSSGRPTGMTVSYLGNGGETISQTLTYNKVGLVSDEKWGEGSVSSLYDVCGRPVQISTSGYDPDGFSITVMALPPVRPSFVRWPIAYDAAGRVSAASGYSYTYDSRGRLVSAKTSGTQDFSVSYTYDNRCNLTSIVRKGIVDKTDAEETFGTLDNMAFSYTGNKLTSLTNSTEALAFDGMTGLGKSGTFTKSYDVSGRLLTDTSRGITNITYNNDGLPMKVSFKDMSQQEYEWDGLGNHVATRFYGVSYTGKQYTKMTRKYTGDGRVIDNDNEVYARYPGGFLQGGVYHWYIRNHQGSNVMVMDSKRNIVQKTQYYPYGEPWREPTGQPWLYSGNERLRLDGINEYDFNARRFNSVEGRFSSWDLLTEKRPWESPYSFCGGDPVNYTDKWGLFSSKEEAERYSVGHLVGAKAFEDINTNEWYLALNAEGTGPYEAGGVLTRYFGKDLEQPRNDPSPNRYSPLLPALTLPKSLNQNLIEHEARRVLKNMESPQINTTSYRDPVEKAFGKDVGKYFRVCKTINFALDALYIGIEVNGLIDWYFIEGRGGWKYLARSGTNIGMTMVGYYGWGGFGASLIYFIVDAAVGDQIWGPME